MIELKNSVVLDLCGTERLDICTTKSSSSSSKFLLGALIVTNKTIFFVPFQLYGMLSKSVFTINGKEIVAIE